MTDQERRACVHGIVGDCDLCWQAVTLVQHGNDAAREAASATLEKAARGGYRPGSGRKPKGLEDGHAIHRSLRLSPEADRIVRAYQATHGSENYTAALEAIIRSAPL